jgi:cyanophycin synthetase
MASRRRSLRRRIARVARREVRAHILTPLRRLRRRRIPVALVTGSSGKTTTSRMLARILEHAGHTVGLASTDGVWIGSECIRPGDYAGYDGARLALRDPRTTAAVLETARGGILRYGLYLDRCDAGALLNVAAEQIGIDGVDTLDQMAAVKRRVTDAARRAVVLNADDPRCAALIPAYDPRRVIAFATNPSRASAAQLLLTGGRAISVDPATGAIQLLRLGLPAESLVRIDEVPACFGGIAAHNVSNAMAAAALAVGLGVAPYAIRGGLASFDGGVATSPGRFNVIDGYAVRIVIDRALHPVAFAAALATITQIPVSGRRLCMFSAVGNRPDDTYDEMARLAAPVFDRFVCYEVEYFRRIRARGEIPQRLAAGLRKTGVADERIATAGSPEDALHALAELAAPGDLVLLQMLPLPDYEAAVHAAFAHHRTAGAPRPLYG